MRKANKNKCPIRGSFVKQNDSSTPPPPYRRISHLQVRSNSYKSGGLQAITRDDPRHSFCILRRIKIIPSIAGRLKQSGMRYAQMIYLTFRAERAPVYRRLLSVDLLLFFFVRVYCALRLRGRKRQLHYRLRLLRWPCLHGRR